MTLIRWMPHRNMLAMQQEMNRLFENFFGDYKEDVEAVWTPRLDLVENQDSYVVKVDLPGLRKEEVKLTLHENVLTISGERLEEAKRDDESYHILERRFGKFTRSFTLPTNIEGGKITAKMQDGALTVTLPKAEAAKPHEINIQA